MQKKAERLALEKLVRWEPKMETLDYNFEKWALVATPEELKFGMLYEYARESVKLRELMAVCVFHRAEEQSQWQATNGRDWKRERGGWTEKDAENVIGELWAGLRSLGSWLMRNIPYGNVDDDDRRRALECIRQHKWSHFSYIQHVVPAYESQRSRAVGRETLDGWWWTKNGKKRRPRPWSDAKDKLRAKFRDSELRKTKGVEVLLFRVNWNAELDDMVEAFKQFVNEHDPEVRNSETVWLLRSLLDDLSTLRLTKDSSSREEAFTRLKSCRLVTQSNPESFHGGNWSVALKRVRDRFRRLFPFETGGPANDTTHRKQARGGTHARSSSVGVRETKRDIGEPVEVLGIGTLPT